MFINEQYVDPSSAKNYKTNSTIQFDQAMQFVSEHADLFRKGPILDVGCAEGTITSCIAQRFNIEVVGIDISEERIHLAKSSYPKMKFFTLDVADLDAHREMDDKSFHAIVSFNALHHLSKDKQEKAFQQFYQLLSKNGSIALLIPGRSVTLHSAINEVANNKKWSSLFTDFDFYQVRTYESTEYYKQLILKSHFSSYEIMSSVEISRQSFDVKRMKKFIEGWLPHLAYLDSKKTIDNNIRESFLDDIVDCYFSKMGAKEFVYPEIMQNKIIGYKGVFASTND